MYTYNKSYHESNGFCECENRSLLRKDRPVEERGNLTSVQRARDCQSSETAEETSDFLKLLENLVFRQNVKPPRAQVYCGKRLTPPYYQTPNSCRSCKPEGTKSPNIITHFCQEMKTQTEKCVMPRIMRSDFGCGGFKYSPSR